MISVAQQFALRNGYGCARVTAGRARALLGRGETCTACDNTENSECVEEIRPIPRCCLCISVPPQPGGFFYHGLLDRVPGVAGSKMEPWPAIDFDRMSRDLLPQQAANLAQCAVRNDEPAR